MSDEELGGAIYTALLDKHTLCSVQELKDSIPGPNVLKCHDRMLKLLDNLCHTGIVTKIGDKYAISEEADKYQEEGGNVACAEATQIAVSTTTNSQSPKLCSSTVPKQQYIVRSTSQHVANCEQDVIKRAGEIRQILSVLSSTTESMSGAAIARQTGLGASKKAVNPMLYFLRDKGLVHKNDKAEWTCRVERISDEDLQVYAAELASKPAGQKLRQFSGPGPGNCPCAREGKNCYHFHQHVTNNQYNLQVGDNSKMYFSLDEARDPEH